MPYFAGVADGRFAEHGLDVELVESAAGSQRVKLLAEGAGDFLLTATRTTCRRLADQGPLSRRAVSVIHARSPISALVRADSDLTTPADLAARRLGAPVGARIGWLAVALQAGLRAAGHGQPQILDMSYREAYQALANSEIHLIANFSDLLPIDQDRAETPLRAIPAGGDTYTSSVLAHDSVPGEVVARFTAAMEASFRRQREDPARGVRELCARYPRVDRAIAEESWRRLEPFTGGGMDEAGWERTAAWICAIHGLPRLAVPIAELRPLSRQ